jgi:hypothetical protein
VRGGCGEKEISSFVSVGIFSRNLQPAPLAQKETGQEINPGRQSFLVIVHQVLIAPKLLDHKFIESISVFV